MRPKCPVLLQGKRPDEEMEHEEPELNLQVRPLSPSERQESSVSVCVGEGGGAGWEGDSWPGSRTPDPVLRPWESHFLLGGPHLSGTKTGSWRTW